MEKEVILLDTSMLIDYFRKKDKTKSVFFKLSQVNKTSSISTVTEFEILTGSSEDKKHLWDDLFKDMIILPFDSASALIAAKINIELKKISKRIEIPDLFIAATAISNDIECATLNRKHFNRIPELKLANF